MSLIADNSPLMEKTKEFCQFITEDGSYNALLGNVETFLNDDEARLLFQTVQERSEELRNKQHSGIELGESEIAAFKELRGQLEQNAVAVDFLQAQDELNLLHKTISKYVGMTLEYGRVPTEEDFAATEGGCCGSGG